MKYHYSIRHRIIIAFCVFGLVLSVTYMLLIDGCMALAEDMVFEKRIRIEIEHYLSKFRTNPNTPLPYSTYIKGYLGTDRIPPGLRQMVQGLSEGMYETDGPGAIEGPGDYHVAIRQVPGSQMMLYLFYDVGRLKINEQYEMIIRVFLAAVSLLVAGVGAGIGVLLSRRIIAPLRELTRQVAQSRPHNLPLDISGRFADDEIGFLAKTLEESLQRIQSFVEREKAFTRDASHELRTPVTVIKGALELIEQLPVYTDKSLHGPLERVKRSVKGMAITIDTFLWLAREDAFETTDQACDVAAASRETFEEYAHLFKSRPVTASFRQLGSPAIDAPDAVFKIAVSNLLRNAFYHTPKGDVCLTVKPNAVEVFNSTAFDMPGNLRDVTAPHVRGKNSEGFGLGLAIVKRLCERFNWHLTIDSPHDGGTCVMLSFDPPPIQKNPRKQQMENAI